MNGVPLARLAILTIALAAAPACKEGQIAPPIAPAPAPVVGATLAPAAPTQYAPVIEARIDRVIHGLLPETATPARFGPSVALADRLAYYRTPGVSIAVIHGGAIEWARGFGVRDVERGEPVTEDTMFEAGSISKPVFALGVMRLVAAGKLSLDEDVNRYLTSWKVPAQGSFSPRITLRQILSHSAGFTVHGFLGYLRSQPRPTVPEVLDGAGPANSPPVRVNQIPGLTFRYSGGGITVGQLAVTDVLGKPFPEVMDELVLHPVGLTHSTYGQPLPEAWRAQVATAYPWMAQAVPGGWHVYPEMAAAGLWTTPSDLARLGIEVARAARGESSFLAARSWVRQMLTRQVPGSDVGIGFFLSGKDASARFEHGGWDQGFCAQAVFYEQAGEGAVIAINSESRAPPCRTRILRAIAREYGWPDYFPKEKVSEPAAAAPPASLAGTYETEQGARFVVQ